MQFEKSKIFFNAIFVLTFFVQISHQNFKCNQDILLSYGLQGFETSQQIKFEMCSFISYNCCRNEDQIKIFQNWVIDGEAMNLSKRFDFYISVYSKLMNQLNEVNAIALDMDGTLNKVKVSNCKIMSFRYQQFNIKSVSNNFIKNLQKLFDFYKKSVQGFYCSLCDGQQQVYFNKNKQKIVISKYFARKFLENALSPLLYIHLHFVHFFNLASRFMQNCSIDGEYKNLDISEQLRFGIDKNTLTMLNNCRNNRNDPRWLDYCKEVIEKFHPTKIESFLTGNIKKINNYMLFLKEDVKKFRDAQALQRLKRKGQKNKRQLFQSNARVLETKPDEKQQQQQTASQNNQTEKKEEQKNQTDQPKSSDKNLQQDENKKITDDKKEEENLLEKFLIEAEQFENLYEDEEIIQPALNGVYNIDDFEIVVEIDGINFLKAGKQTIIDDKVIMLIRDNNKQRIVTEEKRIEEEQKKLEEAQKNQQQQSQSDQQVQQTQRILELDTKKRVL